MARCSYNQVQDVIELECKLAAALDRPGATAAGVDDDDDEDDEDDEDGNGLDEWGSVSVSSSGSGSVTYSTYGESDDGDDWASAGGGGSADEGGARQRGAVAVQEARKQLRRLQSGASRADALAQVLGGRLALKHAGRLSHAGSSCAFVPRYVADPAALAPPARRKGARKWPGM